MALRQLLNNAFLIIGSLWNIIKTMSGLNLSSIFIFVITTIIMIINFSNAISIFREPPDALYGYPLSLKEVRNRVVGSAYGDCQAGTVYQITSVADLYNQDDQLPCIFGAGLTPTKIPEGILPTGQLLSLNSRHWDYLVRPNIAASIKGIISMKADCNASTNEVHLALFHRNYKLADACAFNICPLQGNFASGEYEDTTKSSLIADCGIDLNEMCPDYGDYVEKHKDLLPMRVKALTVSYPETQMKMALRFVGRRDDGAGIFLGKTSMADYFRRDNLITTVGFFYALSFDDGVNPDFHIGQLLPPLEQSFWYSYPGLLDMLRKLSPLDNLLHNPFRTLYRTVLQSMKRKTVQLMRFRDHLENYSTQREDERSLKQWWMKEAPPRY